MTTLLKKHQPAIDSHRRTLSIGRVLAPRWRRTDLARAVDTGDRVCEMQHAFCATGGIVTGDKFSQLLLLRSDQPISLLARWIVHRRIVHFEWRGEIWLPLFQLDLAEMDVLPGVQRPLQSFAASSTNWN